MTYKWEGKGVRILYATPDLPPYNITASKNVDNVIFRKLQRVFLTLDAKNTGHLIIIKALDKKYDGFARTSDKEYDVVRKLVKHFN